MFYENIKPWVVVSVFVWEANGEFVLVFSVNEQGLKMNLNLFIK